MSYNKDRYASDPAYRAVVKDRAAKWRLANKAKSSAQGSAAAARWRKANPRGALQARIASSYGLTLAQYDALSEKAAGRCMCCGRARKLVIDHCHDTGLVRGLICHGCNVGVGLLGDSAAGVEKALDYLRKHKNGRT